MWVPPAPPTTLLVFLELGLYQGGATGGAACAEQGAEGHSGYDESSALKITRSSSRKELCRLRMAPKQARLMLSKTQ